MFNPQIASVKDTVSRGTMFIGAAQAVRVVTQMASVIILSRLLVPEDFGIIAMVSPLLAFIMLFQELGLTQATIQKENITEDEVSSLFWINVIISGVLGLALIALSPAVGWFYGEPRVVYLTAALAMITLAYGIGAQHGAIINRRMEFKSLAVVDVISAVVTIVVAIAYAIYVNDDFWAVYAGMLGGAASMSTGYWIYAKWVPKAVFLKRESMELLNFGAGVTGSNLSNFLARNADNILIGKFWGDIQLGFYDRAYKLLLFPLQQVTNPLGRVMVPTLSRLAGDPVRYRNTFFKVHRLMLYALIPGVACATATADIFIPFLLGENWVGSVPVFQALGIAGLLQPVNNPSGWLFISQGRSRHFFLVGACAATTSIIAFIIGLPYGIVGVAIAYAISEYVRTPFIWWLVGKQGPVRWRDVIKNAGPIVILGAFITAIIFFLKEQLALPDYWVLAICGVASYALAVVFMSARKEGRGLMKEVLTAGMDLIPRRAKI